MRKYNHKKLATLVTLALCADASAGDLSLSPAINMSVVESNADIVGVDENIAEDPISVDSTTITIAPSLTLTYEANMIRANLVANHRRLDRSIEQSVAGIEQESEPTKNAYTNYRFTSQVVLVEGMMGLSFSGNQTQRSVNLSDSQISDEYLEPNSLSKTQNLNAELDFALPNTRYLDLYLKARVSNVKSDRSVEPDRSLDNSNQVYQLRMTEGRDLRNVRWNVDASRQDTERTASGNFVTSIIDAGMSIGLVDKLALKLVGRSEGNELSDENDLLVQERNYSSYGVGFEWFESEKRNISLTYNESDGLEIFDVNLDPEDLPQQEDDQFLGAELNWAFTPRTSLNAKYDKRALGENLELTLKQSSKRVSASISYRESITNYSRLESSGEEIAGIYACPLDSIELVDCKLVNSADYVPGVDEQMRALIESNSTISDEVRLREEFRMTLGYSKRRLNSDLILSRVESRVIDEELGQQQDTARLSAGYELGKTTSVSASVTYTNSERGVDELSEKSWIGTVGFQRKLFRKMTTDLTFRYLKRDSENLLRELTDRRITFSLRYTY